MPKMPKYLDKDYGRYEVGLDSNKVKCIDGYIFFVGNHWNLPTIHLNQFILIAEFFLLESFQRQWLCFGMYTRNRIRRKRNTFK